MLNTKRGLAPLLSLTDWTAAEAVFEDQAEIHLSAPFETLPGPGAFFDEALGALATAMPDFERRNLLVIEGATADGALWVGACGYYCGTFAAPFLHIRPTGKLAVLRFHEFYRIEAGNVVELQGIWDIPDLMIQAGVWPLGPIMGRNGHVPGPLPQDGLRVSGDGEAAFRAVRAMLQSFGRPAADLAQFWHPKATWYGPAGIGAVRVEAGLQAARRVPFLDLLPSAPAMAEARPVIAEGTYAALAAWPGVDISVNGDGWAGVPCAGQDVTLRALNFWHVDADKIREAWIMFDLLHLYRQLGVDLLSLMREQAT